MLAVRSLSVDIGSARAGARRVVDDVSFDLKAGQTLGIVGESGAGKSLLGLAVIGLLPGSARPSGQILFEGDDIVRSDEPSLCRIRGRRIGMVFQEPMAALNPAMQVGRQIGEAVRLHLGLAQAEARAEVLRLLDRVQIPDAARRLSAYPHELSGGQRQRVGIAIALAGRPGLLVADEPTTAVDATVQSGILDLLDELVSELGMGLIFISHDLGAVARIADRTLVMAAGRCLEEGDTESVLRRPRNPVTQALIAALPRRARAGLERGRS